MATLKEIDGHAYQYFSDVMRVMLLSDLDLKKRGTLKNMLESLDRAQVRRKCRCGRKDCLTYEFATEAEYELVVPLIGGAAENRRLLALAMANGDLVHLDGHGPNRY